MKDRSCMTNDESRNICNLALDVFGEEHQMLKTVEECSELIDALMKYREQRVWSEDVITELADVSIMVEQMSIFFGREKFELERLRKLLRLKGTAEKELFKPPF